jgi:hypothetical protein
MALAKKTAAPVKKTAPKASAKVPAKPPVKAPANAKTASAKPPTPSAKAAPTATPSKAMVPRSSEDGEAATPKSTFQKVAGRDTLCQIEIVKDGHFFIARTQTDGAPDKEYKNTVFEDLLTEMVITLQEQIVDR